MSSISIRPAATGFGATTIVASVAAGAIFGAGLAISGMTSPENVLAFLDVTGAAWNPALLFVLGSAVGVAALAFTFILRRPAPVLGARFDLPGSNAIDGPLVAGAIAFGVGWGISGYCPGPAIALLAAPSWEAAAFLPALLVGLYLGNRSRG
jgi:uncharacterized membrane protein YedE/YeeE